MIFENLNRENKAADADPAAVRISVDTKATVPIGPLFPRRVLTRPAARRGGRP